VSTIRARLSAIGIVATMLLMVAVPLFAGEMGHPVCLTKQHDCGDTAQLKSCCCLLDRDRSDDATPATEKTQIAPPIADGTLVVIGVLRPQFDLFCHACTLVWAPRSSPPDLIKLFGTFLI
jgi:hypothetical protein